MTCKYFEESSARRREVGGSTAAARTGPSPASRGASRGLPPSPESRRRPSGGEGTFVGVTPVEALERIAELLMRGRAPSYRQQAFRKAAREVSRIPDDELRSLAESGRLTDIPGVGEKTAAVIVEALNGETPQYLTKLLNDLPEPGTDEGEALRAQLKGDLHSHSDWSDGGDTIEAMATKARDLGHDYFALTDHSPRLKIANGLTA